MNRSRAVSVGTPRVLERRPYRSSQTFRYHQWHPVRLANRGDDRRGDMSVGSDALENDQVMSLSINLENLSVALGHRHARERGKDRPGSIRGLLIKFDRRERFHYQITFTSG